jgi:hypothetical protein
MKTYDEQLKDACTEEEEAVPVSKMKWITINDLIATAAAPDFLINDILESDSHGMLAGASGSYKTFVALDMIHSVSTGEDFCGNRVFKTGAVLYVCGEGRGALARRALAMAIGKSEFHNDNVRILEEPLRLDDGIDMLRLKNELRVFNPALVVFDTFAALSSQTDENSPSDVGRALKLVRETCSNGYTSSIIVHHYGKDAGKGMRGASNFTNDVDFSIEMKKTGDFTSIMSCKKMKDGEFFDDIEIRAKSIDLHLPRQDGRETTSLIVLLENKAVVEKKIQQGKMTDREKMVKGEIRKCMAKHGIEVTDEIKQQYPDSFPARVVDKEDVKGFVYPHLPVEQSSKGKTFSRLIEKLEDKNHIGHYGGYIWIL